MIHDKQTFCDATEKELKQKFKVYNLALFMWPLERSIRG
jgi:hypothetical protein